MEDTGESKLIHAFSKEVFKNCPRCGSRLIVRNEDELECSAKPECEWVEPLPHDIRMRRSGAPLLPGFE